MYTKLKNNLKKKIYIYTYLIYQSIYISYIIIHLLYSTRQYQKHISKRVFSSRLHSPAHSLTLPVLMQF